MDWRFKALLQLIFSVIPRGEQFNYVIQRYAVRSLPASDAEFAAKLWYAKRHIEVFKRYCARSVTQATFYEFGTGWDMTIPLAFYTLGVDKQILIDIRNLVRLPLVNDTINKFQKMVSDSDISRMSLLLSWSSRHRG